MKYYSTPIASLILFVSLLIAGCGGNQGSDNGSSSSQATAQNQSGLSDFELEHGIGPIDEPITIGEIDMEKVEKGKALFKTKCSACHKIDERYIGPALGDVLDNRTPAFVMNMILNPQEMVKKHPVAKKMLQEFMSPMPNQNLTREEARAVVEYLASVRKNNTN